MATQDETARPLYIQLLQNCVSNNIYRNDVNLGYWSRDTPVTDEQRQMGLVWPSCAHTMVGLQRLGNVAFCVEDVLKHNIPGDLIETGVWRGGCCILMRGILKAYGDTTRKVFVADSFEGLPPPTWSQDAGDDHSTHNAQLAVSIEQVKENFRRYDLLDDQVVFLKGFFKDTLPTAPIQSLAVLRLDGDMYESTMQALDALYPKLSVGGYCIVDDYTLPRCAAAIHDYRQRHGIQDLIVPIDRSSVYWKKTK